MLSTIEKILFLKSVGLFARIPDDDLVWIAEVAEETHFDRGERFIVEYPQGVALALGRRIGSVRGRPLLDVDDPVARLQELLEERTAAYEETAHVQVATDGLTPGEVAATIVELL